MNKEKDCSICNPKPEAPEAPMTKYHELTERIWRSDDDTYNFKHRLDSLIREYIEGCAEEIRESYGLQAGSQLVGRRYLHQILGLSTESLSAAGTPCENCDRREPGASIFLTGSKDIKQSKCIKCGKNYSDIFKPQGANPVSEKEWCSHYKLNERTNWYEREANVGSGVFNCVVHHQDKFCAVCGKEKPRTPTEQEELAAKFREFLPYAGSDMNLMSLAEIALTWFHEREKRK